MMSIELSEKSYANETLEFGQVKAACTGRELGEPGIAEETVKNAVAYPSLSHVPTTAPGWSCSSTCSPKAARSICGGCPKSELA